MQLLLPMESSRACNIKTGSREPFCLLVASTYWFLVGIKEYVMQVVCRDSPLFPTKNQEV